MKPAAVSRPQLTAEELQHVRWILGGGLSLVGLTAVPYMDIEAGTLVTLTGGVILAALLRPAWLARVPGWVHTLAFPVIVACFALDLWLRSEVLPAMVRLDVLLLLYRNLGYRRRRDDLQLIVLGLFLVIVAGVLTVSPAFALHILTYTACALGLLLALTLGEGVAGAEPAGPLPPGEVPAWVRGADLRRLARRLGRVVDWRVAALGAALFAGLVALSALLFLAIPRFQVENTMFLDRLMARKAKSGFSETIRLGELTDIQQDQGVALTVDVSDRAAVPAAPYWRMLVLNEYQDGVFRAGPAFRAAEFGPARTEARLAGGARPETGAEVQWTFYLEPGISRFLPLLGRFDGLVFREVQNFRFAQRLALVALRDDPVGMVAYRVTGFETGPVLADRTFAARWRMLGGQGRRSDDALVRLGLVEADERAVREALVQATGGEALPAAEVAARAAEWLRRNHGYALTSGLPPGSGDPLVRWMTSREPGHCELFAGSLVLLARAAGLPARAVTGFRGGSWNGYSNNFTIRNADAHAWAEVFDEEAGGWRRVDPLAAPVGPQGTEVRGEAALAARVDRSWTARLDSLRVFWYRRIVNFDERSQAQTLRAVKEATVASGREFREWLTGVTGRLREWAAAPGNAWRLVGSAAVLLLVLAAGVGMATGGLRWRLPWREVAGNVEADRRQAGRWLVRLPRGGVGAEELATVRRDLERVRFGPRATWPEPGQLFRRARRLRRSGGGLPRA